MIPPHLLRPGVAGHDTTHPPPINEPAFVFSIYLSTRAFVPVKHHTRCINSPPPVSYQHVSHPPLIFLWYSPLSWIFGIEKRTLVVAFFTLLILYPFLLTPFSLVGHHTPSSLFFHPCAFHPAPRSHTLCHRGLHRPKHLYLSTGLRDSSYPSLSPTTCCLLINSGRWLFYLPVRP